MYALDRTSVVFLSADPYGQLGYAQEEYCEAGEDDAGTAQVIALLPGGVNPICIDRADDEGEVDGVEHRLGV